MIVGTGSSSANSSELRNLSSIQAFWLRFGGLRPAGMTAVRAAAARLRARGSETDPKL